MSFWDDNQAEKYWFFSWIIFHSFAISHFSAVSDYRLLVIDIIVHALAERNSLDITNYLNHWHISSPFFLFLTFFKCFFSSWKESPISILLSREFLIYVMNLHDILNKCYRIYMNLQIWGKNCQWPLSRKEKFQWVKCRRRRRRRGRRRGKKYVVTFSDKLPYLFFQVA